MNNNMNVEIIDNVLNAEEFVALRVSVGFSDIPIEQAKKALSKGLFNAVAICDEKVVGMGRIVGDGVMYWYIQDVCILPEYQGQGIGSAIVNRLLQYVNEFGMPDTETRVSLMAAKGKDKFYEKLGFSSRPNANRGPGMEKVIRIIRE